MKIKIHFSQPRGFALVVTLSLMILLTVIAVGLLTLSSISLRASSQGEAMATARANARLALMLALGDLQKTLGPDRAVTATSEILAADPATAVAKPNIAGAWESWDFTEDLKNGNSPAYSTEKTSRFRRWLVSSADLAAPTSRDFVTQPWTGKTVELIGNGSLGANPPASAKVAAGLVPVSKNGKVQGSYAWHVSDESVKARINTYRDPSQNATLAQKRALLAGHRPDPSVMRGPDGTSPSFLSTDLDADKFALAKENSGKLLDLDQVELLDQARGKAKQFRHDVTPYSLGVLADVRRGGLKQDLSSVFEMSKVSGPNLTWDLPDDFKSTPVTVSKRLYETAGFILPPPKKVYDADPYWSNLWGYYNSFRSPNMTLPETTPTLVLPATAASLTANKVPQTYFPGPVIAKVEMVFSLVTREAGSSYLGQYGPFDAVARFDDTVNFIFTPQITLHNPYNINLSFQKMTVTIVNVPVAFRFTVLPGGASPTPQSVVSGNFESLNEWTQDASVAGDKKFVLQIANWNNQIPGNMGIASPIVIKPGEVIVCTPYLNPAGTFLNDSRSGSTNDVFDWQNKLTSTGTSSGVGSGVKMKPGFTPGLGFENNGCTPSCKSSSDVLGGFTNWWMLMIRDPARPRPGANISWDIPPTPGHVTDKYFVEYQAQRPKWWTARPGTVAPTEAAPFFEVGATIQSTATSAPISYAQLKFDYTNDSKLKAFFNTRTYRCPADPTQYLTGEETFVSATTPINAQAKVLPFAVFSAYARTTNGGVYETGSRTKSGPDSPQTNLLQDGRLAGKPFLFHNPSRAVVTMNLDPTIAKPGAQPYELNLQPFRSRGDYENYMSVDNNRVPALTGNTTGRGIKSGSYLEIPTGPMQTIADFRRSNALTSSYLPHFVQPVSNSLLHPLMSSNKVVETNTAISPAVPPSTSPPALLDHSVLANHAFYDRFYFSTFATRGSNKPDTVFEEFMNLIDPKALPQAPRVPLPSQSFQPYLPAGQTGVSAKAELFAANKPTPTAYQKAAEYQMVQGPFNVNSTNVQAWKAVLASMNKSNVATLWAKNATLETIASPGIPILAMSLLNGGLAGGAAAAAKIDDVKTNDWNGYRELSDAQLTTLATEIVKQVRLRGPFLSMSEFVNRQVGAESALTLSGALENAISDSLINNTFMTGNVTPVTTGDFSDTALYNYKTPAATIGNPAAGAPGWISQGDLMRILEPGATVRSDTFVIRVCGEAQDASGKITRAFAEAVVQRVPEYVDPVDRPSVNAYDITLPTAVPSTASPANKTFGRRMNVVSFRWLSSNEI